MKLSSHRGVGLYELFASFESALLRLADCIFLEWPAFIGIRIGRRSKGGPMNDTKRPWQRPGMRGEKTLESGPLFAAFL